MTMPKISKQEIISEVEKIFTSNPSPEMLKKAKHLLMSKKIKIGGLRKKFCKKCNSLFDSNTQIRIKRKHKVLKCSKCGYITRYKLKNN